MRVLLAAFALIAAPSLAETPDAVAKRYGLAGEMLVAKGDTVTLDRAYGTVDPKGGVAHRVGARWRLASISKQVTAAYILITPEADRLDKPLERDATFGALTMRQLLTHHSGLANPDNTPATGGIPAFYTHAAPDFAYCTSKAPTPGAAFAYNNCDYLLAFRATYGAIGPAWPTGMTMARSGQMGVPGFVGGKPEPRYQLASFGAAGGLIGTAEAVFRFDRALMTGKLLSPAALAELWKPEGGRSYQALGQWVFPGALKGCAKPKRIVQRDGEIGGVQTRNYILPDDDIVVIVFTDRSSDDFPIGEIWQGKGFAYDLLSSVACG
jgi:CubicO group peptidase (beta-lactamase class C family)